MSDIDQEIGSQPALWRAVAPAAPGHREALLAPGQRVAAIGCGTSWFVAQAYAVLRQAAGLGETDAYCASEARLGERAYDRIVALSRSGTTTEVASALAEARPGTRTLAVTAVPGTPVPEACDETIVLAEADERSIVQTRFATTTLALIRAALGDDLEPAARDAEAVLASPPAHDLGDYARVVFLGLGANVGLAHEAALKVRETCQAWAESYPAMDYRHGPIALADADALVIVLGEPPAGLVDEIRATGATVVADGSDPLARLVAVQRMAVARARALGLDPGAPRNLVRSIVLPSSGGGRP